MNFSDESYVRLYVRDTKTWLRLGFEGQCVLMFLLRKLDRAGVLDGMEELHQDVALVTGVPLSVVDVGLPRLLERGVFELRGGCLIMPNFIEAQTAIRTDKARQKDSRDRRLAEARLVTLRDGADTPRDKTVTPSPTAKQPLTLYSAVPSSAVPSRAALDPERAAREISKTYSIANPNPPEEYLQQADAEFTPREAAIKTWEHYHAGGLPVEGVERLHSWLLKQCRERIARQAKLPPKSGTAFRGPTLTLEPTEKHRRFAAKFGIDLPAVIKQLVDEGAIDSVGLGRAKEMIGERMSLLARKQKQAPVGAERAGA